MKLKVAVVCLDYGKEEPSAHIPYEIRPLESYCSVPEVKELCTILGGKQVDQHTARSRRLALRQPHDLGSVGRTQAIPPFAGLHATLFLG